MHYGVTVFGVKDTSEIIIDDIQKDVLNIARPWKELHEQQGKDT